ncbi:MAG TPA: sensor domain-containing diguanylate cyclase [Longimicrobiales bacterium]|nr:sensor domain-containing diguanylate cyclase [Longimicrobiales bacterium]
MRVELPRTSTEFLRQAAAHAVRRSTDVRGLWALGLLATLAAYAPVIILAPTAAPWGNIPWLLAPFLAVVGWVTAARRADERARVASWAFAAAAACGLVTQVVWAFEMHVLVPRDVPFAAYLSLVPYLLLSAGAWLALGSRRDALGPALVADAMLIVLAGTAVVLRLVVEPLLASGDLAGGELAIVASLQALGLLPIFLSSLLVLRRSSALAPGSAAALLGASVVLAAGGMLSLAGLEPQPFALGDPFDYLWLLGWLLVAFSGFTARTVPPTAPDMLRHRLAYEGVRRMIVPMTALFLAVGVVDVAVRPAARPETVVVIALLGAILALRTAHAVSLTDREENRKRQLAYTRALLEVTHSLAAAPDLDTTLAVISSAARTVLRTRAAGIELVNEDGTMLETRAAVGLPADVMGLCFPVHGSFTGWVVQHGEARATVDPSTDPYIQPQSLRFLGRSPFAAAPIAFRGETTGALYACIRSEPFDPEDLAFLGAMADQAGMAIERARLFHQVSVLSVTDPLTGLANRRSLERELEREFAAARRGRELTAVMFDLDEFKQYNDAFGHLAGDEALLAFARSLRDETRAMNLVARYGGDEFVALLSDTSPEGARSFVERVRDRFDRQAIELGRGPIGLSAGLAAFDPAMEGPEDLLRAADEELYRQKPRVRV